MLICLLNNSTPHRKVCHIDSWRWCVSLLILFLVSLPVTRKWETELAVAGRQPEPRSFHTATAIADRRVVILGGRSPSNEHFNDFHIFDAGNTIEKNKQSKCHVGVVEVTSTEDVKV